MIVTYKMFTTLTIVLALVTVALFPFWPYSRWGYTPSLLLAVIVKARVPPCMIIPPLPETELESQMSFQEKEIFMFTMPPLRTNALGRAPPTPLPSKFACWNVVPPASVTDPVPSPCRLLLIMSVPLLLVVPPL